MDPLFVLVEKKKKQRRETIQPAREFASRHSPLTSQMAVFVLALGDTDGNHSKSQYPLTHPPTPVITWAGRAGLGRGAVGKEDPVPLLRQISFRKNNLATGNGELDLGRPLCI